MNTVIRWGIIGCGDVTEVKSGPGFQNARGSHLVAVMRRDSAKAADYARRHEVPRWYDDADKLIDDPDVDAVYVATPPGTHEHFALKVCQAGKPCYVEKPMSRNSAEARRMVDAFAANNVRLYIAYYRRRLPRFLKAREILDSGILGQLRKVTYMYGDSQMSHRADPIPWRLQAEHAGAGLFLDLASHALDLLDYLLGPLQDVQGKAANIARQYNVEDHVTISFSGSDGARGNAEWNFASPKSADQFHFVGDAGEMFFPCFAAGPVFVKFSDGREEKWDLPNPPHVEQPLIQTIVDELLHSRAAKSPSTGESGLRTQIVMDTVLKDYYGSREDGFWHRPWPGNS